MSDRVLFISGRCEHCKKILIGIQQHPFLKPLFKVVNVDTQPYPNYVKSVPSILINSQVISGQNVFEYFGKLVEGKKAQVKGFRIIRQIVQIRGNVASMKMEN